MLQSTQRQQQCEGVEISDTVAGDDASGTTRRQTATEAAGNQREVDTAETPEEPESLPRDDIFEVLSNRRRRFTIQYLQQHADAQLGDVAEQVAAWENETTVAAVTRSQRKCVYTSLQQFHLPKMEDKGVIDFDRQANQLELSELAADLDSYLVVLEDDAIPWSNYYLGVSCLGSAVVGLSVLGVEPVASVPTMGVTGIVLAAMTLLAATHVVVSHRTRPGTREHPPEVNA